MFEIFRLAIVEIFRLAIVESFRLAIVESFRLAFFKRRVQSRAHSPCRRSQAAKHSRRFSFRKAFSFAPVASKEKASMGTARLHGGGKTIPPSCRFAAIHLPLHKGGKVGGEVRFNPNSTAPTMKNLRFFKPAVLPKVRLKRQSRGCRLR